jgi:rhodanese-related sulfurtransferase
MNIQQIVKNQEGTIVDVRTPDEFRGGHVAGSINIPLQELERRMQELSALKQPLVLCCASGGRSAQATQYLLQKGLNCCNAGSWLDVNYLQTA